MTKEEKQNEVKKIAKQQLKLIKKAAALVAKPSKRMDVNLRRIGKMLAITMHIRALEMQKQMIIAQPIPKEPIPNFVPGGVVPSGMGIVGEVGRELIISPNGAFIPGGFQTCPISEMHHVPIKKQDESTPNQYPDQNQ